jgi:predicted alpha-1,2-mannosidase
VAYTDSGLWDTFRTQFPFYSVVYPEQLGEIVSGWLNAYREGGRLPNWPCPGGLDGMSGTHADAMVADAVVKDIPGFDVATAYEALRHDAFDIRGGRHGMREYLSLGYMPPSATADTVSGSLDYVYDDWCVAQAAKHLGKQDDYRALMDRSQNYRKLWDSKVGFMRGKNADGTWVSKEFDEFAWGRGYCEGGPWQCSWAVPHDPVGLAELLGGKEAMVAKLDRLFSQAPTFHPGGYGGVIHEMREMAAVPFGQCCMGNQPSFHIPYLYAAIGQPWKTEYWTRKACDELFNAGPRGYPGDEDNGSMSCWYLLSAMGFYPLAPADPSYVLTSPAVGKAVIHLASGKDFVITAAANGPKNIYVQARHLDDRPLTRTWIAHRDVVAGGVLQVDLADKPAMRAVTDEELPYSASRELARGMKRKVK